MSAVISPGYKQTEVGVIPGDWDVKAMGQIGTLVMGKGLLKEDIQPSGCIPAIPYTALYTDFSEVIDYAQIKWFVEAPNAPYVVNEPCVLIASSSNMEANTGKAVALHESKQVAVGREVISFKSSCDSRYISYLLSTAFYRHRTLSVARGTTIKHLYPATFTGYVLAVPPLPEQRAIAAALSDVDALLAKLDQLIAKKRDLKQAAMQQLLTGQNRLPGFSGEWEVKRLGDVAAMGSGGTPPSSVAAYYGGDFPWVSISDMTKGGKVITKTDKNLTEDGLANSAAQMFPAGTILYAMYASLGECSIAGMPLCTSQAILGIRPQEKLNADFLYYYLSSLKNAVKSMGQQGTQANLNKGMVQAFQLGLPTVKEQLAIATTLSDMDTELAALEARRDKTHALKQGMMQELLTGRIRLV